MNALHRARRRAAGFTMIEMLLVLLLMGILLVLVMPSFLNSIQHQKLLGITQQTAILMRLARLQAIKTASNSVVQIDTAKGTVTAFTDLNGNQTFDSATEPLLGQITLPKGVSFMAVDRFTSPPTPAVAVFHADGSVSCPAADLQCTTTTHPGAFGFQDVRGDQLEACAMTKTSGRIVLMKFDATNLTDAGCGPHWEPNGEGAKAWKWN
ncbi:MAG TPA: GspH/FimT family protein [Thermoanaerobaculia bacterium]|jgi:prepilin-type N-terminal cleavage/methylation domain-containing protein|nr:GspH/FimT family protein [Thermoanaerobaculia bacterium]